MMRGMSGHMSFRFAAHANVRSDRDDPVGVWHCRDGYEVYWIGEGTNIRSELKSWLADPGTNLVVLNSFFDREFTIPTLLLRKMGLVPRKPVILSPRGEFANGALSLKPYRKRAWLALVKVLGLTRGVWFHATAPHERADIEALGLHCKGILDAPNARYLADAPEDLSALRSTDGPLRLVFLGRISPVKNLQFALKVFMQVKTPVEFDIFGPLSEPAYWAKLEADIAQLPKHVKVAYKGSLAHEKIGTTLAEYDLFFLPTMGENFGHAINEALAAGLPLLIADTTPWTGLEALGAGWELPISDPAPFAEAIERFNSTSAETRRDMRYAARRLAENAYARSDALEANRRMLQTVITK